VADETTVHVLHGEQTSNNFRDPHSFGFRPGRSAHQAVERARQFIVDDAAWCVDFDLEPFFDRVSRTPTALSGNAERTTGGYASILPSREGLALSAS
jgi:hypothetical protein